jgi:hypothetical protein
MKSGMQSWTRWLSGAAAVWSMLACGPQVPEEENPKAASCAAEDYEAGVRDASEARPQELSNELWAITPSNPRLTWNEDRTAVRMVAWTTFTGYQQGDNVLTREIWLTAVPQLRELCRTLPEDAARIARINQYLGLPPATERDNGRKFVEMWVRPENMFRPCMDPEIDDTTCGLSFPEGVATEHRDWYTRNFASSFGFWQTTRYPWTGLGYTYDWCNASTRVGASEFVVRSGSTVSVTGIIERDTYCAP